jgi:hypothetical protein
MRRIILRILKRLKYTYHLKLKNKKLIKTEEFCQRRWADAAKTPAP